ncbi:hypothetical protein ACTWP5_29815 [Streptomyces sp. 4N509B]|uniref:hypothetical protein n=1 Tax=Streptomyces sp. 4N509B TaxID=3457413 RepID=UPI003FD19CA1
MKSTPPGDAVLLSAIGSADLPADLEKRTRARAPRKVNRLLERALYAPFVAATELLDRAADRAADGAAPPLDRENVALYTVSNWDPSIPIPDYASEPAPDLVERLSTFYIRPANPTDWLCRMPNNPLCNVAITAGLRGPSMHYIGGADALSLLTTVAASTVASGMASAALLVAFDLPEGTEHLLARDSDATAAAVLIGPAADGLAEGRDAVDAVGAVGAAALARFAAAAEPGAGAVATLDRFVEHLGGDAAGDLAGRGTDHGAGRTGVLTGEAR